MENIWKKLSIFFDLEYWKSLHVWHCLEVMHIEKNCCESIIGTLLDILRKTNDWFSTRMDLMPLGIRKKLTPQFDVKMTYLPPTSYTLTRDEKKSIYNTLFSMKVPKGYSSNFKHLVSMQDLKVFNLKYFVGALSTRNV